MKKLLMAAICVVMTGTVYADVVKKDDLIVWDRTDIAGGQGTIEGHFAFKRDGSPESFAIKEIGWLTLEPGESIGYHKHDSNEDAYIIISGVGTFKDTDGQEYEVTEGDVTIVRNGQSHALTNTGTEDLIILDVIAQK